ncbi:MAG: ABC transporter ATP-binding protein [Clostridia bacterium]|nr:ABC transporter ATP-binding protein [Clostridia bacterium]
MKRNLYFEDEIVKNSFRPFMLKRLLKYCGKYKGQTIGMIAVGIIYAVLGTMPSIALMLIVNYVLPEGTTPAPNALVWAMWILIGIAVAVLGTAVMARLLVKLSMNVAYNIVYDLRCDLFDKLMELSFDYYDSHPSGKILVRVTNYTDGVANVFMNDISNLINNVLLLLFAFGATFILDARIALVVTAALVPLTVGIFFLSKTLHKRASVDKSKNSNLTAFVAEDINGISVIQAFNREKLNGDIHTELCDKYRRAFMRTTTIRELVNPLSQVCSRIICMLIVYFAALVIIDKGLGVPMSLGAVLAIDSCMEIFSDSIGGICGRIQKITEATTNLERIFDTLDSEVDVKDCENAEILEVTKGDVTFDDVNFSYVEGTSVLENFSLDVKAGQTVAIVGATGAGKTTIVNLLSRFYNLGGGRVCIDGTDISRVTLSSLRRNVGVMMQDSFIFGMSVLENIRFSRPEASDEECKSAARSVGAEEFILRLENGYDTEIKEADTLSGGERQLISFARLMLSDPKIIILDEATSHIDTETEKSLQTSMNLALAGRTAFVIAHRLSTIRDADKIIYIDNKSIAECGTHDELIERKGKYYELINSGLSL